MCITNQIFLILLLHFMLLLDVKYNTNIGKLQAVDLLSAPVCHLIWVRWGYQQIYQLYHYDTDDDIINSWNIMSYN